MGGVSTKLGGLPTEPAVFGRAGGVATAVTTATAGAEVRKDLEPAEVREDLEAVEAVEGTLTPAAAATAGDTLVATFLRFSGSSIVRIPWAPLRSFILMPGADMKG